MSYQCKDPFHCHWSEHVSDPIQIGLRFALNMDLACRTNGSGKWIQQHFTMGVAGIILLNAFSIVGTFNIDWKEQKEQGNSMTV